MMNDYKELIYALKSCQHIASNCIDCPLSNTKYYNHKTKECEVHLHNIAADAIEQLVKERDELTTKCCRLEQERDAAVAAVHKQCSTCKRVDFCATDAGQPTLWACVSAAKCNWEWRGVQEDDE